MKESGSKVTYAREASPSGYDIIMITTLFTYKSKEVFEAISEAKFLNPKAEIIVGGIMASIIPDRILKKFPDVKVFVGTSDFIDQFPIDYSLDWGEIEFNEHNCYLFTSRGCPNNCSYCAVSKIEGNEIRIIDGWRDQLKNDKEVVVLMDNNLTMADPEHLHNVIDAIKETGKKTEWQSGIDHKMVDHHLAKKMASLPFIRNGVRLAYDRMEDEGSFQAAVTKLRYAGVTKTSLMSFILFNFNDTPAEADYRCRLCYYLGVRPYPQPYVPLLKMKKQPMFVNKHWSVPLIQAFKDFWYFDVYTHMSFDKYIKGGATKKLNIKEEDIELWNKAQF